MDRLLWVCAGSALGGGARYLISLAALRLLGPGFPYGTLLVNVLGSFLVGAILPFGLASSTLSPGARLFLTTGVMGGLTTYSTFNHETLALASTSGWPLGLVNLGLTVVACLAAGLAGIGVGRAVLS